MIDIGTLKLALDVVTQERARARRHRVESVIVACDTITRRLSAVLEAAEVEAAMQRIPGPLETRAQSMADAVRARMRAS